MDGVVDPDRLSAAVAELDADVLALQEVDVNQPRSHFLDLTAHAAEAMGAVWHRFVPTLTGVPWDWQGDPSPGPGDPQFGIAVLSRLPVLSCRRLELPAAPDWVRWPAPGRVRTPARDQPRAALIVEVRTSAGPLTVVGTHLSPFPGSNVRQLRVLLREIATLPRPLVLLGDLNLPGPLPSGLTGLRRLASVGTFPVRTPVLQYDHLLVDGDVELAGEVTSHRLPVSDHRAVSAELTVHGGLVRPRPRYQRRSTVLR